MFFIWNHDGKELTLLLNELNNYHPNIMFTHESNKEDSPYLHLNVELSGNKLSTDLYVKWIDRHQYLHYTSSRPEYEKKSAVYSQALRLSQICSEEKEFEKHICKVKSWVSQRDTRKNSKKLKLAKLNFLVKQFSIEQRLKEVFR